MIPDTAEGPFGMLAVMMEPAPGDEEEFNAWYDTEHIPERLRIPGFRTAQRWVRSEVPRYLAVYDLTSPSVLQSEDYLNVAFENYSPWSKRIQGRAKEFHRYEAVQLVPGNEQSPKDAGGLLFFAMNIDPAFEEEFNAWYDTEHLPRLAKVPGVLSARRFRATSGPHRYFAVYHLESPHVADSDPWREAAETPWTHRIRGLYQDRVRRLYVPYQPGR